MTWLDEPPFYELMQQYRHAPAAHPEVVVAAFEAVKDWVRSEVAASDAPERDTRPDPLQGIRDAKYLNPVCSVNGCQWLASPRASAAPTEQARRKFMQFHNRYLGWGFDDSGEPHRKENAGVMFTSEGWSRPYERFTLFEKYADHGGDINAAECAVIDKAMAAYAALSSPSPAPPPDKERP